MLTKVSNPNQPTDAGPQTTPIQSQRFSLESSSWFTAFTSTSLSPIMTSTTISWLEELPEYPEIGCSPPEYWENEVQQILSEPQDPEISRTYVRMIIDIKRSRELDRLIKCGSATEIRNRFFGRMTPRSMLNVAKRLVDRGVLLQSIYFEFAKVVCYILEWEQLGYPLSWKRLQSKLKGKKILI